MSSSLFAFLRRRRVKPLTRETYMAHALVGAAYTARMCSDNPSIHAETQRAYKWAEQEFLRVARREVGERDLIG